MEMQELESYTNYQACCQNKKGEWVATFPKLKHEDLTRNELMGCNDCSSEFEINSCNYEDENGEYKNECIANLTEVEEDNDQVYWC